MARLRCFVYNFIKSALTLVQCCLRTKGHVWVLLLRNPPVTPNRFHGFTARKANCFRQVFQQSTHAWAAEEHLQHDSHGNVTNIAHREVKQRKHAAVSKSSHVHQSRLTNQQTVLFTVLFWDLYSGRYGNRSVIWLLCCWVVICTQLKPNTGTH